MAELRPYPFAALITRMFRELRAHGSIFDLSARKFCLGFTDVDTQVRFHGKVASSPLGPAAGPQSQMAQNIVLSWLTGCRIAELKTVQVNDELVIPRPCIDMQTVGYNVEWSQELKLAQSLDEYVKGAMLVEILRASGQLDEAAGANLALSAGFEHMLYDMSVGYDLAGIQTPAVRAFIEGMLDCRAVVDRLRAEIPDEFAAYRDLDYPVRLSDTLTLSTFHGCPPDEIERIIEFLLDEYRLHCVVKLNPTLLGKERARHLLREELGYHHITIPDKAFDEDTQWHQAKDFVGRLGAKASALGLGFGVKFSNTLIVNNDHRGFFPATESVMYLSGQPLHVLAMNLVDQFRGAFADRYPISFSAGIERKNFPDAVAIGLVPVTVCSDLLRPGGYSRASGYLAELRSRMLAVGAAHIDDYCIRAYGHGAAALAHVAGEGGQDRDNDMAARVAACAAALADGGDLRAVAGPALYARWVSECRTRNTATYVAAATADPRYKLAANSKPPRKIGSQLVLFDCITCDKCVPVCPNDANFTFVIPAREVPVVKVRGGADGFSSRVDGALRVAQKHQIGNFADFCNECGNCDIFCPEDGGPYLIKPRFFGSLADWSGFAALDGFYIERWADGGDLTCGRFAGQAYRLERRDGALRYSGDGFALTLDPGLDPADSLVALSGHIDDGREVDLSFSYIMGWIRDAVLADDAVNYISCLPAAQPG